LRCAGCWDKASKQPRKPDRPLVAAADEKQEEQADEKEAQEDKEEAQEDEKEAQVERPRSRSPLRGTPAERRAGGRNWVEDGSICNYVCIFDHSHPSIGDGRRLKEEYDASLLTKLVFPFPMEAAASKGVYFGCTAFFDVRRYECKTKQEWTPMVLRAAWDPSWKRRVVILGEAGRAPTSLPVSARREARMRELLDTVFGLRFTTCYGAIFCEMFPRVGYPADRALQALLDIVPPLPDGLEETCEGEAGGARIADRGLGEALVGRLEAVAKDHPIVGTFLDGRGATQRPGYCHCGVPVAETTVTNEKSKFLGRPFEGCGRFKPGKGPECSHFRWADD